MIHLWLLENYTFLIGLGFLIKKKKKACLKYLIFLVSFFFSCNDNHMQDQSFN